jgi:hypothetical protein
MTKRDRLLYAGKLRTEPEVVLDADMSRRDLVDVLRGLRFAESFCVVWLDRPVRDFLIAALTDSRRR